MWEDESRVKLAELKQIIVPVVKQKPWCGRIAGTEM